MSPFTFQSKSGPILIRQVEHDDISRLIELNKKAFLLMAEENVVWSERQLQNHLRLFPTGQLVAIVDDAIVGAVASLIIQSSRDPYRGHTYGGITDGGYFHNHDPQGDTLYGADVYVDPDCQGIGHQFFDAREAQACKYRSRYAAFCAVNREPDDPRRPETYRSLEPCWKKRGYIQQPDIKATFDWREVGKPLDSSHTLTFWIKELTS